MVAHHKSLTAHRWFSASFYTKSITVGIFITKWTRPWIMCISRTTQWITTWNSANRTADSGSGSNITYVINVVSVQLFHWLKMMVNNDYTQIKQPFQVCMKVILLWAVCPRGVCPWTWCAPFWQCLRFLKHPQARLPPHTGREPVT